MIQEINERAGKSPAVQRKAADMVRISDIIRAEREEGVVERQGSNRSGKWIVKK